MAEDFTGFMVVIFAKLTAKKLCVNRGGVISTPHGYRFHSSVSS